MKSEPATTVHSQYFGQSSFSKLSVVQEKSVVRLCSASDLGKTVPETDLAIYAPMGCGFQTGAGTILNVLKPTSTDSLVIFGLGSVGLAALMAAAHLKSTQPNSSHPMQIIAVDIVSERLALATELGATYIVNARDHPESELAAAIRKLTPNGVGATLAVDCTGRLGSIEVMVAAIGPQGKGQLRWLACHQQGPRSRLTLLRSCWKIRC